MLLCTLKDTKANLLHHPYLYRTETDFIRAVQQAAKNPEATITQYPADFDLLVIGEWSETDGIITTETKRIGSVLDMTPTLNLIKE